MKLFMCFGGAAAVADDGDMAGIETAVVAASHRGTSLSSRWKLLSGKGDKKKPFPAGKKRPGGVDVDSVYGASTASSSVPSSAPLSSAASLDSAATLSSSSCSSSVSSSSFLRALPPPPPSATKKRQPRASATSSQAAGAAAVVLCLLMVVFCGRVGATLLTSTALYLFPRRWPAPPVRKARDDDVSSPVECDDAVSSASELEETAKWKVVREGFLGRNRKQ